VTAEERLEVCKSCFFLQKTFNVYLCKKCGCFLELKIKVPSAECPMKKWGEEQPRTDVNP